MTTPHRRRRFVRAAMLLRTAALTFVMLSVAIGIAGCRESTPAVDASAATSDGHEAAHAPGHVHLEELQLEQVRVEELSSKRPSDCIKLTEWRSCFRPFRVMCRTWPSTLATSSAGTTCCSS